VLALLYDIHGNVLALEAVLADARAAGARRFLLGGDYALFGAWPAETLARLRGLEAEWIRGNGERWAVDPSDAPPAVLPAIDACRAMLGPAATAELAALPEQIVRDGVRYCHASPLSDMAGFDPRRSDDDARLLAGASEPRVVFGHTHVQFSRPDGGGAIELVNPGSVGMPVDGDHRAAYALVRDDGTVDPRRVEYDWAASAAAVRERLGAAGETAARRIEAASFDV
jgi:diadenosine tetraphosphatase ApaH/serine/threonine PP2A family protein phosphatase